MGGQPCSQQCHQCSQCAKQPVGNPGLVVPAVSSTQASQWREESVTNNLRGWKSMPASTAKIADVDLWFEIPEGATLGVRLVVVEEPTPKGVLVVAARDAGAVLAVTSEGTPGIFPGDAILEVDGRGGSATSLAQGLQEAARVGGRVQISARPRVPVFDAILGGTTSTCTSTSSRVGLQVALVGAYGAETLQVHAVTGSGLVPEWNAQNGFKQVVPGDRIVQVNGKSSIVREMYAEMQRASPDVGLQLRIATPPRVSTEVLQATTERPF